jgi:hypothetical protein
MITIAEVHPQPSFVRTTLAIEHRDRRVVGLHDPRPQEIAMHQVDKRRHQLGGIGNPTTHCRSRQSETMALGDLCLAVQRLMVGVLADHDMRQKAWAGQPLLDGHRRLRGARDRLLAALAGKDTTHVLDHFE